MSGVTDRQLDLSSRYPVMVNFWKASSRTHHTKEEGLELVHTSVREEERGVLMGNAGAGFVVNVPGLLLEELDERVTGLVRCRTRHGQGRILRYINRTASAPRQQEVPLEHRFRGSGGRGKRLRNHFGRQSHILSLLTRPIAGNSGGSSRHPDDGFCRVRTPQEEKQAGRGSWSGGKESGSPNKHQADAKIAQIGET